VLLLYQAQNNKKHGKGLAGEKFLILSIILKYPEENTLKE